MNGTIDADVDFVAVDRFMTSIFYADDDINLARGLIDAIDEWTATASAEHNNSEPFVAEDHDDQLKSSLLEMFAAVAHLNAGPRPGINVMRALSEALSDWRHD